MKSLYPLLLLLLPVLACPTGVSGQIPADLIPRELFFKEKDKVNIHLSMDGANVFYQKKGVEGAEKSLYYLNARSPLAERSLDFEGELVDYLPVYDNGLVAVVKKGEEMQVYYTILSSEAMRKLDVMPFKRMSFLHLSERFPNKVAVEIESAEEGKDGIYLLDLLNSNQRPLGGREDFTQLFFDQNFGKVAGLQTNEEGGNTIFRFHEGEWTGVRKYPFHPEMFLGGMSRIISVSKDGSTIYATDNLDKDKATYVSIDVATGELTELASDPDADVLPYAATLGLDGKPTAVISRFGEIRRHIMDEAVAADFDFLKKEMPGNVSFVEASQDGQAWLVRAFSGGPVEYYHFDRKEQTLTPLFNDYSYLDGYDLASRKTYTVSVRDGMKFPVNVFVPSGMAKADGMTRVPLPTIFYVHGGPWAGLKYWDSWEVDRHLQLLANRGYAVVQVEFRGTVGLGKAVCDAGTGQWGLGMHQDLVDITDWAIQSGIANPKRLGVWGWSYGGYATNFALGAMPDLYACGLSIAGVSDLKTFAEGRSENWQALVADPATEEGATLLTSQSPFTFVGKIKAPLLLACGGQDTQVPPSQSENLAKALSDAGKKVVFFQYPDEPHSFLQPESWVSFWAIAEDMLHRYVGGRKQPAGEDISKGNLTVVHGAAYIEGLE